MLARAEARRARRLQAAVRLQTAYRMHAARRNFLRVRQAVLTIQAAARGKTARATALDLRCAQPSLGMLVVTFVSAADAEHGRSCQAWQAW